MNFWLLSRQQCARRIIPFTRSVHSSAPIQKFGFALDIDGVLTNGPVAHPKAKEALTKIQDSKSPFILFTNGGGVPEHVRSSNLSSTLDHPIGMSQLLQSHLPFKLRANDYRTVLVVGGEGEKCRLIAEDYGFLNVLIPEDFYAANPDISPFSTGPPPGYAKKIPENTKIDAIFVFNDPRDWALSIQVIIDVLLSDGGKVGTRRAQDQPGKHVPLYFASSDLLWANSYPFPRLGQGAFQRALWGAYIGYRIDWYKTPNYRPSFIGKPGAVSFRIAESMIIDELKSAGEKRRDCVLHPEDWPLGEVAGPVGLVEKFSGEGKEIAGEGKEADGEGKEADGEDKVIAGEGKEADGEGEEADGEGEEADGEGEEADGEGEEADGEGEEADGEGEEVDSEDEEIDGDGSVVVDSPYKNVVMTTIPRKRYENALKRIYMIGDNPRSDIMGANIFESKYGIEWVSILVKSGVYKSGLNHGAPRAIVDDVSAAVDWALENERRIENGEPLEAGPFHIAAANKLNAPKRKPNTRRRKRSASKGPGGPKESKGPKGSKGPKESKGSKESKESKGSKDSKESKKPKPEKKEKVEGGSGTD